MDLNVHLTISVPQLTLLTTQLTQLQTSLEHSMATLQEEIDALKATVAKQTTVDQSAIALLNGLSAQLAAAIASAANAGATPAQLQALVDLNTSIDSNDSALADSVTVNTPAATPPAP